MSTTAFPSETPVDKADPGLKRLLKALDGVPITGGLDLGTNMVTSLAHLCSYIAEITKDTPRGDKGETSTKKFFNPDVKPRFFKPTPLYLTEGILYAGKISGRGRRVLEQLSEAQAMSNWNESTVTRDIIGPACDLFVDIFSLGKKIDGKVRWAARMDGNRIKLSMTAGSGSLPVAKSIAQMETPRAIGGGVAEQLTNPVNPWNFTLLKLYHQVVKRAQNVWIKNNSQDERIHSALAWAPGHFVPLVYDGATLGIGQDLSASKKIWPDIVICRESWTQFFNVLGSWIFMVLITVDEGLRKEWLALCPEQVKQAQDFLLSGKPPSSNSSWSTLTRSGATVLHSIRQAGLRLIATSINPSRFRMLTIRRYDTLVVDSSPHSRLPFGLPLPDPVQTHTSSTALSLIYAYPNVVVKVFNDIECYARERVAYDKLKHLQGYGIPILYASGRCAGDGAPFLVISNEGECLGQLNESERATLEPLIKQIHEAHIHHHDLHLRNVVRGKGGQLRIIDFGQSVLDCGLCGCGDGWMDDWES